MQRIEFKTASQSIFIVLMQRPLTFLNKWNGNCAHKCNFMSRRFILSSTFMVVCFMVIKNRELVLVAEPIFWENLYIFLSFNSHFSLVFSPSKAANSSISNWALKSIYRYGQQHNFSDQTPLCLFVWFRFFLPLLSLNVSPWWG